MKPSPVIETRDGRPSILRKAVVVEKLNYYRRSDILHQLTIAFCRRFLPAHGDRTVDQMVQAARSTKQNIVEGHSDGQTSVETEVRLLGVARGSCRELLQDYQDYMAAHGLSEWKGTNPRFAPLHRFCRDKTALADYQPHFARWTDDEMANCAVCLAHMVDKALTTVIAQKDEEFVTQGGIKERMTAARLAYRTDQRARLAALESENAALRKEVARLRHLLAQSGASGTSGASGSSGLSGSSVPTPPPSPPSS